MLTSVYIYLVSSTILSEYKHYLLWVCQGYVTEKTQYGKNNAQVGEKASWCEYNLGLLSAHFCQYGIIYALFKPWKSYLSNEIEHFLNILETVDVTVPSVCMQTFRDCSHFRHRPVSLLWKLLMQTCEIYL